MSSDHENQFDDEFCDRRRPHCGLALTLHQQLITICPAPSHKLFNPTLSRIGQPTNQKTNQLSQAAIQGGFRRRFCKTCVMLFLLRIKTVLPTPDRRSSLFRQPNTGNRDRTIRLRRIDEQSKVYWAQLFLACVETDTSSPEF